MREVAGCIAAVLNDVGSESAIAAVRDRVEALTSRFPLYSWKRPGSASA